MKEGKFMIQDLADVLSQRKNISAEKARDVARMFFDTILAGLEKDRFVKIKGLGTFKLVSVDNRESVDVNSGERIVIEGHSKVSFTPDNALKEAVNRPFAHFETVVLNDEVTDEQLEQVDKRFAAEQEQANEVVSKVIPEVIPEEKPIEEPIEESIEKPVETPVETVIETPAETPAETVTETPIETAEVPVEKPEEAPKAAAEEPVIPVVVQQETQMDGQKVLLVKLVDTVQVDVNKNATNLMENNEINNNIKSGKSRTALWIVCVVIALLLGYILGYFRVFGSSVNKPTVVKDTVYIEKKQEKKANADTLAAVQEVPAAEVKAQEPAKPQPVVEAKPVEKKPVEKRTQIEETNDSGIPQVKYGAYNIVGTQETYTVKKGETVRIIAERYLGARDMAIYISTYNRIKNPDLVSVGTVLKIPKLEVKKK